MISFVVPAHNEERWIGACLNSVRAVMVAVGGAYEVVVVDDASTDATARIAEGMGARVMRVEYRNIAAVRNAGMRAASGELLVFVDADTQVNERAMRAALEALRAGAVGGGCLIELQGPTPVWARVILFFAVWVARRLRWACGCFVFSTRAAYDATGGFAENLSAGEDLAFVQALKKVGRFVVLGPKVVTSGRKLDVVGPWDVIKLAATILVRGPRYESGWVRDILYGRRAEECRRLKR